MNRIAPLLVLLAATIAGADEIPPQKTRSVGVSFAPQPMPEGRRATLTFRSEDDPAAAPVSVIAEELTGTIAVPIGDGVWALEVASDDYWHARQYILPTDQAVVAQLLPKAQIKGRFEVDGGRLPAELQIRLFNPDRNDSDALLVSCPATGKTFQCDAPAGTYDLRLSAPGYIPHIWTGVALEAKGVLTLRDIRLQRGQSISARVTVPKGTDVQRVRMQAEPRNRGRAISTTANARGQAMLTGVAPGEYIVMATHPDGLFSNRISVVVRDGSETLVPETLELNLPRTVALQIMPELSPAYKPWVVEMTRSRGLASQVETIVSSRASELGEWQSPPLQPDAYELTVATENGDVWHREPIKLASSDEFRSVTVRMRRLRGEVKAGERMLSAVLSFTAPSLRSVSTTSDEEGKFEILLPDPDATEWKVGVSVDALKIHRTVDLTLPADPEEPVSIELPMWTLSGAVVDSDGKPVDRAIVEVAGDSELEVAQVLSDEKGTFLIAAVPNGNYALVAKNRTAGESAIVDVAVRDADAPPITLTIMPTKELRGRIVSKFGPVGGARVQIIPRGVRVPVVYTYTTREDGRFGGMIPTGATDLDLLVAPPGFAFTAARVPYRQDVLTLVVQQTSGTIELTGALTDPAAHLFHDGAIISLGGAITYEWPTRRTATGLTVPQMEPGLYRFCADGRCAEGFLPPNGTLRLTLANQEHSRGSRLIAVGSALR